jgi:hypothetical protein
VTPEPWYEQYFTADYWSYADAEYTAERTQAEISYLAQTLAEHAQGITRTRPGLRGS